jgi:hypothetical protein
LLTAEEARILLNGIPVTRMVKLTQFGGRSQAAIKNLLSGQCSEPPLGMTSFQAPSATGITNTTIGTINGPFPKSWRLFQNGT